jgi:hypothetical protein
MILEEPNEENLEDPATSGKGFIQDLHEVML